MKATCPVCNGKVEVKYYFKVSNPDTYIIHMSINIKCPECGSIFPMSETMHKVKESTRIHQIKDARDNANYIG